MMAKFSGVSLSGLDPAIRRPASQRRGPTISSRKPIASPGYMLQGLVTKPLFSLKVDPFHWR